MHQHAAPPVIQFLTFLCLIIASALAYFSFASYLKRIRSPNERRPPRKTDAGSQMFGFQLALLLTLCGVRYLEGWSLTELGVSTDRSQMAAFLVGIVSYVVLVLVHGWAASVLGIEGKLREAAFNLIRVGWPRDRSQKLLYWLSAGILNPVTEEVLFRGVIIHAFGEEIGNNVVAVVVGLTLSLMSHAYQGAVAIPFQLLFHGLAVVLLFSPFGLVACISLHLVGDLYPMSQTRRIVKQWATKRHSRDNHDRQASPMVVVRSPHPTTVTDRRA